MSSKDFFVRTLPLFDGGDDVGMVLSPQCFHNLNLHTDIFNHSNVHFWYAVCSMLTCLPHFKIQPAIEDVSHVPARPAPQQTSWAPLCRAHALMARASNVWEAPACLATDIFKLCYACREYMQPGYDAMGFISCTGTNFLVRCACCNSPNALRSISLPCVSKPVHALLLESDKTLIWVRAHGCCLLCMRCGLQCRLLTRVRMCWQVRANALLEVGGSPTWTLTEDYALGMQLKKYGWHCRYVQVLPNTISMPQNRGAGAAVELGRFIWHMEAAIRLLSPARRVHETCMILLGCLCRSTWLSVRRLTRSATATSSARAGAR